MSTQPSTHAQLERPTAHRGRSKNQAHQYSLEPPKPTKHGPLREDGGRLRSGDGTQTVAATVLGVNQYTVSRTAREGSVAARIAQLKNQLTPTLDNDVATPGLAQRRLIEWLYGSHDGNDQPQGLNL